MLTFFLWILLLITLVLFAFRFLKTSFILLFLTGILYLLNGCGFIPYLLSQSLESSQPLTNPHFGEKNIIVLLGGGVVKQKSKLVPNLVAYSRIAKASELYFLCKKSRHSCRMIISGGDPAHAGYSEAEIYQGELTALGIPSSDILLETQSLNTFKNAEFTRNILKTTPFDQLFLVTSGIHIKRSLLYFSYFDLYPTPAPSDYLAPIFSLLPIGYNFAITDFAIHEYAGIVRFYFYNFMGWNKK